MDLNNEVYKAISGIDETSTKKSVLTKPKSNMALYVVLGLVIGSFVVYKMYKSNKK